MSFFEVASLFFSHFSYFSFHHHTQKSKLEKRVRKHSSCCEMQETIYSTRCNEWRKCKQIKRRSNNTQRFSFFLESSNLSPGKQTRFVFLLYRNGRRLLLVMGFSATEAVSLDCNFDKRSRTEEGARVSLPSFLTSASSPSSVFGSLGALENHVEVCDGAVVGAAVSLSTDRDRREGSAGWGSNEDDNKGRCGLLSPSCCWCGGTRGKVRVRNTAGA